MNIAIYPRKSKYSDKSDSISNQIESCREFIGKCYGENHNVFVYDGDEGFSGGNTSRPGYQKMLQDIEQGRINMVVCYMIDRISRNISDFCNFYAMLQEKNCRFVSVKEQIDDSTAMGRAMLYICQVFANLERDNITERITDNLGYLASEGYWFCGTPPYGYRTKKIIVNGKQHSTIEKDPDTIDFYYMLVNMFLSGKSMCGMQTYFRKNNIKTPKGSFISTSMMHKILSNPVYAANDTTIYDYFKSLGSSIPYSREEFDGTHGITIGGRKRTGKHSKGTTPDQWTIYIGKHEPLISGEKWVAIQKKFKTNLTFKARNYDIGLLRGVLKCKCCGNIIAVSTRIYKDTGTMGGQYYCNIRKQRGKEYCQMKQISVKKVDTEIINFINSIVKDKTLLEQFQKPEPKNNNESEIFYIEKSIKSIKEKIDNLMELIAESGTAAKYMLAKVDTLDKQLGDLEAKRSSLLMEQAIQREEEKSVGETIENCKKLIENFDALTYTEKNKLIKSIFRVLYIDPDGKIQIGKENFYF